MIPKPRPIHLVDSNNISSNQRINLRLDEMIDRYELEELINSLKKKQYLRRITCCPLCSTKFFSSENIAETEKTRLEHIQTIHQKQLLLRKEGA
jgi:hypothetical protein